MERDEARSPIERLVEGRLTRRRLLEVGALTGLTAALAACGDEGGSSSASSQEVASAAPASSAVPPTSAAESSASQPASSVAATTAEATTAAETTAAAADAARQGGTLRVAFNTVGNDVLDPNNFSDEPTVLRAFQMYDRLFEPLPSADNLGGTPTPMLAESAEPNADWTEWTIRIREGVTFHDGSPLTVEDVIYSFQWALGKENGFAGPAGVLINIDVDKIAKVDERTLTVPFTSAFVYFLQGLCSAPSIVKAGTTDYAQPNGTGPFKFVSFAPNQQTVMERNESYWQPGLPHLDGVTMILFDDATSQMNALLGGQVDSIGAIDPTIAKTHEGDDGIVLAQTPSSLASYFYVRVDKDPFTDNRIRTALKLACDRQQLVDNILLGYGSIGNDLPGKGYADYNDALPQRTYDPEAAKALLAEAGLDKLEITGLTYPDRAPEFAAFQQQAKAAGIEIELQTVPLAQYYAEPYWPNPTTGFAQTRWPGTFAYFAQNTLLSNAPFPETGWKDADWDAGFLEAVANVDEASRNEQMKALQEQIYNEGGLIAWGYSNLLDFHTDKVQGVQVGPDRNLGFYNLKNAWLAE